MFKVKMKIDGTMETLENVVSIEFCTNEDGSQIILWYENGTGARFFSEGKEKIEILTYGDKK